ncbi:hypothetical protein [Actomonas aquatica]|uniref:Uncharacterized protein n=1 Tax=Actomonas aquatica TaxID=2866162 RepID=A0ABZ1C934_9BACT|nr:hypothetical protein [Opitutus sp. WL0086]WRQ87993.1 hypothetical protein K1X11_001140 [Opitutus sp. WL0086]
MPDIALRPVIVTLLALLSFITVPALRAADLLLLVGAPGEEDYAEVFAETAEAWADAAAAANLTVSRIDGYSDDGLAPRDQLITALAAQRPVADDPLWIVYVGHGTYDLRNAQLNLAGPDVSATELGEWLGGFERPLVFVHGGSASAPFVNALSRPNRIIITATESGHEVNYARFGLRFARAVIDPEADIDRDGQTSLLEAFLTASQQVQAFYLEQNRLATEHALIDDNGDGRGTPYDFFNGTRLAEKPTDPTAVPDGARARVWSLVPSAAERALTAEQRSRRDALEAELEQLRTRRDSMPESDYLDALEVLFRQLGQVYRTTSVNS